ncbi:uncharacterized protein MONBRDRAFT_16153, partial [Monosiga brevicollis MX1]
TQILQTADPARKVQLTTEAISRWYFERVTPKLALPDQPPQDAALEIVEPHRMKLGKGGSLQSRIAILHSLAAIELHAVNLAWDIIARFGSHAIVESLPATLPRDFYSDFVTVAEDECRHFNMLAARLKDLGSYFGALPVHNGLWQSAEETSNSLLARLAIVHMVHEARGLDVTPNTIEKFRRNGDTESANMLQTIYEEEITHVAAGMRWFRQQTGDLEEESDRISVFHRTVLKYFHGVLKPPFNDAGRAQAGFTEDWYLPLVQRASDNGADKSTAN